MTDLSPETVERMVALVRRMAVIDYGEINAMPKERADAHWEARSIAADLPQPVDPDLLDAREACAIHAQRVDDYGLAAEYRSGELDLQFEMQAALVAIRGRTLATTPASDDRRG